MLLFFSDEAKSNGQKPNSSSNGFKVNTEKTKQQYRSNYNEKQSWSRPRDSAPQKTDKNFNGNTKHSPDERPSSFNRERSENNTKNNSTRSKTGRAQKKKEDSEKPRGKRKTAPKKTQQQREESQGSESTYSETAKEYSTCCKFLHIIKDVFIIFACFITVILFFVLKFCWNVGKKLLEYTLLLVLFIVSR